MVGTVVGIDEDHDTVVGYPNGNRSVHYIILFALLTEQATEFLSYDGWVVVIALLLYIFAVCTRASSLRGGHNQVVCSLLPVTWVC